MLNGFQVVQVQEVTVSAPIKRKGSNMIVRNVDVDGKPFGQIWTFKARGETHGFHAKVAATEAYRLCDTLEAAVNFIRNEA